MFKLFEAIPAALAPLAYARQSQVRRMAGLIGLVVIFLTHLPNARAAITVGTGNLSEVVMDYATVGEDRLAFIRFYNTQGIQYYGPLAALGMNWRSNYDRYLIFLPNSSFAVLERADGQVLKFKVENGVGAPDTDVDVTLVRSGNGWLLTDEGGTKETYGPPDGTGRSRVVTITAPNGYTQTLSYNDKSQLIQVSDSHSRKLGFTYADWTLSTVTTPDGLVLSYSFDSSRAAPNNRLSSVHYSTDQLKANRDYLYENPTFRFLLTGVRDGAGKRLATWTYDKFGRCTSSQLSDGANLTTITYGKDDRDYPVNTVTNALGEKTVYKFEMLQGVPKVVEIDHVASATRAATTMFFAYDADGYLVRKTDSNGKVTTYSPRTQYESP